MQVRKLDTDNPLDVDRFIDFPFELYKDNQQWVPPLVSSARRPLIPLSW